VEELESRLLLNAAAKHAAAAPATTGTGQAATAKHAPAKGPNPPTTTATATASKTKPASPHKASGNGVIAGAKPAPAKIPKQPAKPAAGAPSAKKPAANESPSKPSGLMAVSWTGEGDGVNWTDPNNWTGDAVPNSNDNVTINVAGSPTITLASGSQSINSLVTSDPIDFTGGTLAVATSVQLSANLTLAGGTLQGATITQTGSADVLAEFGTLNGVTADATLDMSQGSDSTVTVLNGLVLNSSLLIGNAAGTTYGSLYFGQFATAAGSLTGTGAVLFGGYGANTIINQSGLAGASGALTIGPGITIHGSTGAIYDAASTGSIANHGTIDADTAGGTITVGNGNTNPLTSTGTLEATNGGTLSLGDNWSNTGTISVNNATLDLAGSFVPGSIGTLTNSNGTVNLTGTLTGDLALTAATGSWNLYGGTIVNGTYTASGGSELVAEFGTLNGVTADATLDLSQGSDSTVTALNGLVLNASLLIGNAAGTTYGSLYFGQFAKAAGSLTGNGSVLFGGYGGNGIINASSLGGAAGTLTIGAGITIHGQTGQIYGDNSSGSIVNDGTIDADVSGGEIVLASTGTFTNGGMLEAFGGGTLAIPNAGSSLTNLSSAGMLTAGTYAVYANSTLDFGTAAVIGNVATILLSGSAATFDALNGITANAGSLTITGGYNFAPGNALTNTGTLTIGAGGTLTIPALSLNGGNTTLSSSGNAVVGTLSVSKSTLTLPRSLFIGPHLGALPPGALLVDGAGAAAPTITLAADAAMPGTLRLGGDVEVSVGADAVINTTAAGQGQTPGALDLGGVVRTFNVDGAAYVSGQGQPDLSISAQVTDGGIFKTGAGTVALSNTANAFTGGVSANGGAAVLSNPSSFTGGITMSANGPAFGTVSVASDADLGAASNAVNLQGGTLDATATFATSRSIVLGNSAGIGDGTIAVSSGDALTLDGPITGKANLIAAGPGTLLLNTAVPTGQTHITGGTLLLGTGGNLSQSYLTTVDSGATLDLGSQSRTIQALAGAGAINLGSGTLTIADPGSANATQFSGTVTGTGVVTRTGPGSLTLSGNNSFAGGLTATGGATVFLAAASSFKGGVTASAGGTVVALSDAALGDSSNAITLSGGTLQASASITTSRAITVSAAGGTIDVPAASSLLSSGLLSGPGNLVVGGGGTLRLSDADSLSGSVALTGGTLALSGGGTLRSVPSFSLSSGSTLLLDDSTASGGNAPGGSRLGATAAIASGGGQVQLLGASGTGSSESMGPLTLTGGQTLVSLTKGAGTGSAAMLLVTGLSQGRRGTGILFETGDGTTLGGNDRVMLGSYPAGPLSAWASVLSGGVPGSAVDDSTLGVIP
jgi:fibronectin-binding autotransporter adhesin